MPGRASLGAGSLLYHGSYIYYCDLDNRLNYYEQTRPFQYQSSIMYSIVEHVHFWYKDIVQAYIEFFFQYRTVAVLYSIVLKIVQNFRLNINIVDCSSY